VNTRIVAATLLLGASCISLAAQQVDEAQWGKNTPGVQLATHEGPRQRTSSGTILIYNILGRGFPADKTYDLWFWRLDKKPENAIQGVSFDKRGLLVCSGKPGSCNGGAADDPVNIKAAASLGEPKRFAVVSTDGKVAGFIEAVPFPIEAKDKGCKLSLVRQSQLAESVVLRGSGFTPQETLTVQKQPSGNVSIASPTVAADGTWQEIVEAKVPGQNSGTATIKAAGKSCSVSVSFNWGEGSNQHQ
jgi:hypothetical protein